MKLFEAKDVTVRYGAVRALEEVAIEIEPGVVHGVIGPNGAGKSTFIDALSGRRKLTHGKVLYRGDDISTRPVVWRRRHGISRSFQKTSVFPSMTVREQLDMVAWRNDEDNLDEIVEVLGLGSILDMVCSEIAYGTQRSVDLAMALIGRPSVVLLDEPCAGLVAAESIQTLNHIRHLCKIRDVGAIVVDHNVEGIFGTCDVVTVLNLGQVLTTGDPVSVRKNPDVVRAYLGSAA
ncbi:hypothetical protein BLJ79_08510 [Arthrobacter sp. UCD-GKA]|uniref:ABC transporter ATP-binding protein n=1 Tax=Arthrobacter sp. UCD-GKA TaxID=1913576 RepID=UPI0008DDBEF1|nr:ATP-binding cassette domain-containing protein [Arthrobacter sp. UCD-GKA]OIH85212.1 hypothetical protein BLJ79_08510 [Arthrobacter sp. UCD-GKA]